jgi:Leucine-rich repeat (LRR) protein
MKFMILTLAILALSTRVYCKIDLNRYKLAEITGKHLNDPEYEFDSMEITSIAADTFTDIRKTCYLMDLSYNKLTSLPDKVFEGMTGLLTLNLGNNKLVQVSKNLFSGLVSLEELKLKGCGLTSLDSDVFEGLKNIRTLDLSKFVL